ncbi:Dna[CI] antecedent, DciA family protein [Candidatus Erwinia haradaeae]|uniref:Dna[CI] antecedent, DciA family protein n=1 Tax=Candidatus Erwinia haradaeae TaxID=1922217 RepID=A0A451CZM1_9GAMM|nr:DciA family protein [Candidatus Erwinia haradaeae]VFP78754.1 Dna[CI] antecedent, DciA family protein [Candidatus Erwinia haradaeae]
MDKNGPKLIKSVLDQVKRKSVLLYIQQRVIEINKLTISLQAVLPEHLKPWCRVANFRNGILVIEIANANILMSLRYEESNIFLRLREEVLPLLSAIKIRINPSIVSSYHQRTMKHSSYCDLEKQKIKLRYLSKESANILRSVAQQSPDKLKKTLERLASLSREESTYLDGI